MTSKHSRAALAMVTAMTVASLAWAQGTGVISGVVTDASTKSAIPGQTVSLSSPALALGRTATTDSSGTYRFSQLPPGTYSVKIERTSFRPGLKRGIQVRMDAALHVDIDLRRTIGAAEETISVGPPPSVDVGSATQGTNLTRDFLTRVPLVAPNQLGARTVEQAAMAAPQVVPDRFGFGYAGSLSTENLYLIDGAAVNDATFGSLRTGIGAGGPQLPVEFVEQANVMTGGASAEFGRASGGVLNVVTKSGGNEWRGSAFGSWFPGAFTATSLLSAPDRSSIALSSKRHNTGDFGAELGGALIKDRLWFYGGVMQSFDRRRVTRSLRRFGLTDDGRDFLYDEAGAIRTQPLLSTSGFEDRQSFTYLAKLTFFATPNHTIAATITGGPQRQVTPDLTPKGHVADLGTSANTTASIRYSGSLFERRLLIDATAAWTHSEHASLPNDGTRVGDSKGFAGLPRVRFTRTAPYSLNAFEDLPAELASQCEAANAVPTRIVSSRGTARFVMACPVTGNGASYVLGGPGLMTESQADRLAVRANASFLFELLGHHVAKAGVDLDWTTSRVLSAYSGTMAFSESPSGNGTLIGSGDTAYLVGPNQRITQVSSTSSPSQLGTGFFLQDSWHLVDAVTVNAGLRYDTQQLFASNGQLALSLNNLLSPRVGLVYDFTHQGRSKVFINYGLYQQALPLNVAGRGLSGETRTLTTQQAAGCDPINAPKGCVDGTATTLNKDPLSPSPSVIQLPSAPLVVDPDIQPMTKGEVVAGLEYEVWSNLRVGFVGTHSWLVNAVETLSTDDGATWFLGNPGSGLAKGLPAAERKYFAATLYANRAFATGWLVQASYTHASLFGNLAGLFRPESGLLDPNLTRELGTATSSINRTGFLPTDHTHQLKAYVAKDFELSNEWLVSVGASYEGLSGAPLSYLASSAALGSTQLYAFPRGAAGRLPWTHTVNVRGGLSYRISKEQSLQFTLDVFNLFNAQEPTEVNQQLTTSQVQPASVPEGKTPAEAACLAGNDLRCTSALRKTTGGPVTSADLDPTFKQPLSMQAPLSVRLGVKLSF